MVGFGIECARCGAGEVDEVGVLDAVEFVGFVDGLFVDVGDFEFFPLDVDGGAGVPCMDCGLGAIGPEGDVFGEDAGGFGDEDFRFAIGDGGDECGTDGFVGFC